jgi:hypothetical protein
MQMRLQKLAWIGLGMLGALSCATMSGVASAQAPAPAPAAPAPQPAPSDLPPAPPPAQPDPAPQPATPQADVPPPPPSYQTPGAPPTAGSEAQSCMPECRSGFVCQQGQCVSACNPPCPGGQRCTAERECVADPGAQPPPYFPQPAAPEEGSEQHDGFMLRATIGFGGASVKRDGGSAALFTASEAEYSGPGLLWSLDVGGSPVDNLVLHGRLSQITMGNPNVTLDDEDQGTIDGLSAGALLIGPAVSYYFMPINLYATAAVGLGVIVVTDEDEEEEATSDAGVALNFDVGKEFWVNDQWGLGVAGRFWYTAARDEEAGDAEFDCIGGGLLFSATYQ